VRLGLRYDGVIERLAAMLNLGPFPVGLSMFGMAVARSVQIAQRVGVFAELAGREASASDVARRLGLREEGTRRLLDVLVAAGHLRLERGERYRLAPRAARWLDPRSGRYVGDFLADTAGFWHWWGQLEPLLRDGTSVEMHDRPADDPFWRTYILGQYELARLASTAVAKAVRLPRDATSVLDVAGGHGEYAMALCRRHDGVRATVVDLPGSAVIGREIVAGAGMSDRVRHVEGDMFTADLGGPHDGALAFNIVHHLSPERARRLFSRIAASLRPGAPLCVLDLYDRPAGKRPAAGSYLGLFFHLTSGADTYAKADVAEWITQSGFGPVKSRTLGQAPGQALLRAERTA
jgi:hypothetical protein